MSTCNYTQELNTIQIELSTMCNALCLGCTRTDPIFFEKTKPYIESGKYLNPKILINLLVSEQGKKIKKLQFNGTIDEPFVYPKLHYLIDILSKFRPDLGLSFHTNGGVKKKNIYRDISLLLARFKRKSHICFNIDGLKDTNHIYRQNVDWDTVISNLKDSLSVGADVRWQFLSFPWNKHQIDEAKSMAKELGCSQFNVRPDRSNYTPTPVELREIRLSKIKPFERRPFGGTTDLEDYEKLKGHEINCSYKKNSMIFIDWSGKVWPCCFISNLQYSTQFRIDYLNENIISKYEPNFNDLNYKTFEEIVSHPFYTNDLVKSWENGGADNKMAFRCVSRCSSARLRKSDNKPDNKKKLESTIFK